MLSHRSAFKHGITIEHMEHAYDHVIVVADLDPDSDPPKVLLIGPDAAGNLLELIALVLAGDELLIIHAMPLRPSFYPLLPDPTERPMTSKHPYTTSSGRTITDDEIDAIANDVATSEFDVEEIRRRGRPTIGTGPAQLVPVRIDPELLDSLRRRAARDHATNSEVIRAALREYLAS